MAIQVDTARCVVCGACIPACPTNALSMAADATPRIEVDRALCAECSACIPACPAEALSFGSENVERKHDKQAVPDLEKPAAPRHDSPPRPATRPDPEDEREHFSLLGWRPGQGSLRRALRRRLGR
jgi:NAD-dependent dihydropyrimidine dehydrogenase PreA subunit